MIEFMVIAAPRSGTTWAANWLTTDHTLCMHDPLFERHYTDLDHIRSKKRLGVSCTGLFMWPEWLNSHPARKVILHRDLSEVNESLEAIGLPPVAVNTDDILSNIHGIHADWMDLFNKPKSIYEFLLQKDFDSERHAELMKIEMQPNFYGLTINKNVTRRLVDELRSI